MIKSAGMPNANILDMPGTTGTLVMRGNRVSGVVVSAVIAEEIRIKSNIQIALS